MNLKNAKASDDHLELVVCKGQVSINCRINALKIFETTYSSLVVARVNKKNNAQKYQEPIIIIVVFCFHLSHFSRVANENIQ
jgi:hypothetical protein